MSYERAEYRDATHTTSRSSAFEYGTRNSPYREKMRTECWIEHCIWAEEIVSADVHVAFKPITAELPVPGPLYYRSWN